MASIMVINSRSYETRVALIENDNVSEVYIERANNSLSTGNIYKGTVIKVLPGMQAAFIDIGTDLAAFLHVKDIIKTDFEDLEIINKNSKHAHIQDLIKEGKQILVQISKEPMGTKGPRVTTNISLPGRFIVLVPMTPHLGISRKILDSKERERLKSIFTDLYKRDSYGIIVRTASEKISEKLLKKDYELLVRNYNEITKKEKKRKKNKGLIYEEIDVSLRAIRELLSNDIQKIIVDDLDTHKKLTKYLTQYGAKRLVELYDKETPVFEELGIEYEISRALERKVWLKSGGYIVIDQAEALVAIDVNTGKYIGKRNLEETILNTNLEAAKEIAYQLKLRNLGGIIVIDFIDMEQKESKEKVLATLHEAIKKDKAKINILKVSELGVVEMTRKRTRENLLNTLSQLCPYCDGNAYIRSNSTMTYEIFRLLEKMLKLEDINEIKIMLNPVLINNIYQNEKKELEAIKLKFKKKILLEADEKLHIEQYELITN